MSITTFKGVKPKPISLSRETLVSVHTEPGAGSPLVLQPGAGNINLIEWVKTNREAVEAQLAKYGALLFRNFNVKTVEQFEQFMDAVSPATIEYGERSSPRTKIGKGVYTSTDHPEDQAILLHTEQSYTLSWPMKICFFCVTPALRQGRTPIADSRKILARLSRDTREKFLQTKVMYVRNYGEGLGLHWTEVFQTRDKRVVEQHCRNASIEWEWKDAERLRTRQTRPAIRRHPRTGELVWFNHALFFHFTSLEAATRESILKLVSEEDVPFNTFYGDGSPIESSVLEEIREAYEREKVGFDWQAHDILLLDNMLTAHGREPFAGPRKIVVSMVEPFSETTTA